jgi:hypothetical protein
MDGSLPGQFLQGRHIQPVSTQFALTALPEWVYDLMTWSKPYPGSPKVSINQTSDALGVQIVYLSRGPGTGPLTKIWLLNSDFQLCMQIVNTLPLQLFPQESKASIMTRIKGALQVKFAGRGQFPQQP